MAFRRTTSTEESRQKLDSVEHEREREDTKIDLGNAESKEKDATKRLRRTTSKGE